MPGQLVYLVEVSRRLALALGPTRIVAPRGMASGNGSGLTGLAIKAMASVWFIWALAPSEAGRP